MSLSSASDDSWLPSVQKEPVKSDSACNGAAASVTTDHRNKKRLDIRMKGGITMSRLVNIATQLDGFVMDVPSSNFAVHQTIQIYPLNIPPSLNQTWTIVDYTDEPSLPFGFVNIYAGDGSSRLCLDVPSGSTTPGTIVQLYPINGPGGTANQRWQIQLVADTFVYIVSALNVGLVLDVRGGAGAAHTPIQTYTLGNQQPNQLWLITQALQPVV
jgi:hypothetical protein